MILRDAFLFVFLYSFVFMISVSVVLCPAHAVDATHTMNKRHFEKLKEKEHEASQRAEVLQYEVDVLSHSRSLLNRQLIETAARIREGEEKITVSKDQMVRLGEKEAKIRHSFASRRIILANLLGVLGQLSRHSPPALIVRPEDALAAIRSMIALGSFLPVLKEDALKLARDLSDLVALRKNIAKEKRELLSLKQDLEQEQERLEALIDSKQRSLFSTRTELLKTRREVETLAREAVSIKALISRMAKRNESSVSRKKSKPPSERSGIGFSDLGRIRPAVSFRKMLGKLSFPVHGKPLSAFGEKNRLGRISSGISIATRVRANVTSPADGWIVYAGTFRSYGHLLILNVGEGYYVVLAGLRKISVEVDQFVLSGEPVGAMGVEADSHRLILVEGSPDTPVLYVEFRKDGNAIDSGPWWSGMQEEEPG